MKAAGKAQENDAKEIRLQASFKHFRGKNSELKRNNQIKFSPGYCTTTN